MAPTIKPASGPNAMPLSMMTAKIALKWGMGMAVRATMAMAHITAMTTSSRACGFLPSKAMKKGTISSRIISVLVI